MSLEFRLVDVFSRSPYTGNIAGVILKADRLADDQMRWIASELNAPMTTFVLEPTTRDAAVRFRWFTPACEVKLCGHAMLGGVHALLEAGLFARGMGEPGSILPIETASGILTVRTESDAAATGPATIWLDMPNCEPLREPVNVPAVCRHLGLDPAMLDPAIKPIVTADRDVILAVRELSTLLQLTPAFAELSRYARNNRLRGALVTTTNVLTRANAVQSRFFAPAIGIDEDSVSGSVHGPLGLHLVRSGVIPLSGGRADFWCAQARAGGRAGLVRVAVAQSGDEPPRVRIGGTCITTASGTLHALPKPT